MTSSTVEFLFWNIIPLILIKCTVTRKTCRHFSFICRWWFYHDLDNVVLTWYAQDIVNPTYTDMPQIMFVLTYHIPLSWYISSSFILTYIHFTLMYIKSFFSWHNISSFYHNISQIPFTLTYYDSILPDLYIVCPFCPVILWFHFTMTCLKSLLSWHNISSSFHDISQVPFTLTYYDSILPWPASDDFYLDKAPVPLSMIYLKSLLPRHNIIPLYHDIILCPISSSYHDISQVPFTLTYYDSILPWPASPYNTAFWSDIAQLSCQILGSVCHNTPYVCYDLIYLCCPDIPLLIPILVNYIIIPYIRTAKLK